MLQKELPVRKINDARLRVEGSTFKIYKVELSGFDPLTSEVTISCPIFN